MTDDFAPNGYAAAALKGQCEGVAGAAEGTRNHVLNVAAFNLGGLIKSGALVEAIVTDSLTAAARAAGLDDFEIAGAIRSGYSGADVKRGEF